MSRCASATKAYLIIKYRRHVAPATTDSIIRNAITPGIADIFLMPHGGGGMWRGGPPYRGQALRFCFASLPISPRSIPFVRRRPIAIVNHVFGSVVIIIVGSYHKIRDLVPYDTCARNK